MAGGDWVVLGRIGGLYGVHGWLKVFSHTQPREGIVGYRPLYVGSGGEWRRMDMQEGRAHGKGVVLKFVGYDDRDSALALLGCDIAVRREQLPEPEPGEYYWSDLQGLRVVTLDGVELGVVDHLLETGANDVLVVEGDRQRLLPFLQGDVVRDIDLRAGMMRVDWDPDF